MTKKDFQLIAATLASDHWLPSIPTSDWQMIRETAAYEFALILARTNPRFDRVKFLKACGVEE